MFGVLLLLRFEVADEDLLVYVPVETDDPFLVGFDVFDETPLFVRTLVRGAGVVVSLLLFAAFPLDGVLLYAGRVVV